MGKYIAGATSGVYLSACLSAFVKRWSSRRYITVVKMLTAISVMIISAGLRMAEAQHIDECLPSPDDMMGHVITLSVDHEDNYYYSRWDSDTEKLRLPEVTRQVLNDTHSNQRIQVFIRADINSSYGAIVRLVHALQRAQVTQIAMIQMEGYLCMTPLPIETTYAEDVRHG